MYINSDFDKETYIKYMKSQQRMLNELHILENSESNILGDKILRTKKRLSNPCDFVKYVVKHIKNRRMQRKLYKSSLCLNREDNHDGYDFFSKEKIAVYTCLFGKYDNIYEPFFKPDNIDYYIITDQELPSGSLWIKKELEGIGIEFDGMCNVDKNRWVKMFPHILFKEYQYSIYIDANVVPVLDLTAMINRIENVGIAMYWHKYNNCVYQEALYNIYVLEKITKSEVDEQVKYLREKNMPENYGMTTCNVIARDHENDKCRKIMEDWWREYKRGCRRDQLSFTYVAWKNNVSIKEIATLGDDVWNSDLLLIKRHL